MNEGLRDAAFRAGVWSLIEAKAKEQKDAAKAELKSLEPGDAVSGKWHGQPVAKATMSRGRKRFAVTSEQGLADWVAERWPSETVTRVNPAFMKSLEKDALDKGGLIDRAGEVCPFVEVVEGDPYVSVRKADGADAVIAELFRTGAVGLDGIASAALPAVVDAAHLDTMPPNRWVEVEPEVKPEVTDRYTQDMEAGAIG